MSEIICFYNCANDEKESGCFVLESNVELNDLKSYLIRSKVMKATDVLLDSRNKPIETEEEFTAIKEYALETSSSISFNIASSAEIKEQEEPFGPLIKQILSTLNIDHNSIEQLSDITDNIPFPFSIMAGGYLANIRANPNAIEQIVQSVAPGYSAEVAPLIAEVKHAFAFFDRKEREREEELARQKREEEARLERERIEREQREREEQEEREREAARAKEREFIGPIMKQILEKYDVELDIDTTDIPVLVRYIPSSYKLLVQSVMKEIAANEYYINYAIRYIAQLLDVSESALVGEVQKAFKCVKDAIATQVEEEKKQQVRHHAICDKCESYIHGIRYKCLHCPDYDLCSECEETNTAHHFHEESHVFAKIHTPSNTLPSFRGCHRGGMRADRHHRIAKLEATVEELKNAVAALSNQ